MKKLLLGTRIILPLVIAGAFFCTECYGASSPISIKVKDKSVKDKTPIDDEVETDAMLTVTSGETNTEAVKLTITLKNKGTAEQKGLLRWCFISDKSSGKTVDGNPAEAVETIFSPGSMDVTIPAVGEIVKEVDSETFSLESKTVEKENYNSGKSSTTDTITGDDFKAYVVLFVVDGEVVAKGGTSRYLKKYRWVNECMNASSSASASAKPLTKAQKKAARRAAEAAAAN